MGHTEEHRQAVLARLAPPYNESIKEVADAEGLSLTTIYNWRRAAKEQEAQREEPEQAPSGWTARDKFEAVVETAAMNEVEISVYCRSRGLYPEDLAAWRKACEQATDWADERGRQRADTDKEAVRRIRELERELSRKEKALAEAAALLMLRKKAAAIWGDEDV